MKFKLFRPRIAPFTFIDHPAAYTYFPLAHPFVAHGLAAPAAVIAGIVTAFVGFFLCGVGQRYVSYGE